MYRFVAFVWDAEDRAATSQAAALTARLRSSHESWRCAVESEGLIVFYTGTDSPAWQPYLLANDSGVVIGALFRRSRDGASCAAAPLIDADATRTIIATGGAHLVRHYWGCYVAFLRDPAGQSQWIIRDPSGSLPCYTARLQSVEVYFSWLADAVKVGVPANRIDWPYVAARLQNRFAYGERTGLMDVSQVLGGERVTHHRGQTTRTLLWNPLQVASEAPIEGREHGAAELRRITRDVVQSWAGCYQVILHSLSGGLDSSIVLACLKNVHAGVTCLNAFTSGAGDERALARLAARRAECELLEQPRTAAELNLELLLSAHAYPEPINYMGWLEHVHREAPVACERGAGAIFTGLGGDEVFGRSGALWAVSDFVRDHGMRPSLFTRAMDAARLEHVSVWRVLRAAIQNSRWRPQAETDVRIQLNAVSAPHEDRGEHPALRDTPLRLPSGKRRHAYLLTPPIGLYDPVTVPVVERVMPLHAQPLLELCLRIPTYTLIESGWDRALARRAFQADLPAQIVSRHAKGEISEYARDVLIGNLPFLRELLLKGRLVEEGVIERAKLAQILSIERARNGVIPQLYDCLNVEVWLRSCAELGRAAAMYSKHH